MMAKHLMLSRAGLAGLALLSCLGWLPGGCTPTASRPAEPIAPEKRTATTTPTTTDVESSTDASRNATSTSASRDGGRGDAPSPAEAAPPVPPVNCSSGPEMGALALTAEEASTRHGRGVSALSQLSTSQARPVEVCGPEGQYEYLLEATCDDGSRPLSSAFEAMRTRAGSVGPGGRCDKIVDLYVVTCPEQRYEVYMDMYFCGPGETFMR